MDCDRPFKYKVVTKPRFPSSNYAMVYPFFVSFCSPISFRARKRERERNRGKVAYQRYFMREIFENQLGRNALD